MERLHVHWAVASICLLIAGSSFGAVGAAPRIQAEAAAPPPEAVTPVEARPPTCRPDLQPDASCRLGFRTDQVCYRGGSIVSRKIGPCVVETPPRPAAPLALPPEIPE